MTNQPQPLPHIGWKERLDFPDWGLRRLRAKIDTGAQTSALHVARYECDESTVTLWLDIDPRRPDPLELRLPLVRIARVRSSIGVRESRPVVVATVQMGGTRLPVEFTLTNRARMRYRIILGRQALAGRFVIDPEATYLLPRVRRRRRA